MNQEAAQLVKMANQIADNFSYHEDAADRIREHLQRFWAPSMRRLIKQHLAAGESGLRASAVEAVQGLETD
ncbi:MAG: formate dehydrogenase subunit delta [Xanthomonadales bacterium]|nr:formate dehydrogenase subunit delta [Xanthomonadales bacterium]